MDFHCFVFNSKAKCVKLVFSDQNYSKLRLYIYIFIYLYIHTLLQNTSYITQKHQIIYIYMCVV